MSIKGLPSGEGSQFDSATPVTGLGPIAIFNDPSGSFFKGEWLLKLYRLSGLSTTR